MDADLEGEEEIHTSKRRRVAELVPMPVLPEVGPPNWDFDVNEIFQSSPNLVVATIFGEFRRSPEGSSAPTAMTYMTCQLENELRPLFKGFRLDS